ncbi:hypothetical protein [Hyphomicrobium sp. D-2]|uniref:hypothetical protein n=1 Tax=Hyphomicrobium sp. D-2 TaxID=3041621 RepID=UPI002455D9C5|nr:hypothetical protein [Hyphomicrobium sp. D-2]MDH4982931.1 hypothetical protein [Hyphomicrobium sp. D-2]
MDATIELAIVLSILIVFPPVIWGFYHHRYSGLAGYLWRRHPGFVFVLMAFGTALWTTAALWVAGRAGILSPATIEIFSTALSGPVALLAIATFVTGVPALIDYRRLRARK